MFEGLKNGGSDWRDGRQIIRMKIPGIDLTNYTDVGCIIRQNSANYEADSVTPTKISDGSSETVEISGRVYTEFTFFAPNEHVIPIFYPLTGTIMHLKYVNVFGETVEKTIDGTLEDQYAFYDLCFSPGNNTIELREFYPDPLNPSILKVQMAVWNKSEAEVTFGRTIIEDLDYGPAEIQLYGTDQYGLPRSTDAIEIIVENLFGRNLNPPFYINQT